MKKKELREDDKDFPIYPDIKWNRRQIIIFTIIGIVYGTAMVFAAIEIVKYGGCNAG